MTRRDSWLLGQLPMGMLDDEFFFRFASMFEAEATTLLAGADNIANVVDPTVAPPDVVRWLGSWIGAPSLDSSLDESFQRRLVRGASESLAWRGTRAGLERFLEGVTGQAALVEETGAIRPDTGEAAPVALVRMTVAWTAGLEPAEFAALVADEVPANAAFEVWAADRRIWPPTDLADEMTEAER